MNNQEIEKNILNLWKINETFEKSLQKTKKYPIFTFYDGPPFATGLPHYGHILAGTIKDIICRYATMKNNYVPRRAGWDAHGLPIEYEIEKKLGIKTKSQVIDYGIGNYNKECESIVMRCADQWKYTINRIGRWIDFDNDYKTMDTNFMESVWWVFKELWKKDLVYKGFKIMPYSNACNTPLSNFEAKSNYKDIHERSVIVTFPLVNENNTFFLVWTTTPWTLPSNIALCVNPNIIYVKLFDNINNKIYILAESLINSIFKNKKNYNILEKMKGIELKNIKYIPIFNYFEYLNTFKILIDDFVLDDSGTGIVHLAPAFGEDDFRVCIENNLITKDGTNLICPIDPNGSFTSKVKDFEGLKVKECDKEITDYLKSIGRLFKIINCVHSYPFCWRSDTPLIYKAVSCWFVNVEKIKDKIIENNKKINWIPGYVGEKRFHNWLKDTKDWCISRNRYWGTPLPIWVSDDMEEIVNIGSIDELSKLSGIKLTNLHRHHLDKITIPSKMGKGKLKRVEEVFDCWFESGSMPYAQSHYPFENKDLFEKNFPADFIAEGLDQTRGWFYTLMVLSTALFDKPAFKNVIVNGLVLAEDGKKMSKRLKNYPDPLNIVNKYGADALRMYLIDSPVVKAESLRFKESGVRTIANTVI